MGSCFRPLAAACLIATSFSIPAETVYRCLRNGTLTYTQNAADPSCQPMEVTPYEPDPETVARQKDELKKWRDDRSQAITERRRKKAEKSPPDRAPPGDNSRSPPGPANAVPTLPGLDYNQLNPRNDE